MSVLMACVLTTVVILVIGLSLISIFGDSRHKLDKDLTTIGVILLLISLSALVVEVFVAIWTNVKYV